MVLFKQVTGIRSPVLHGLISAVGSAKAVLRERKKATNATSAGGNRGMVQVYVNVKDLGDGKRLNYHFVVRQDGGLRRERGLSRV